MVGFAGLEVLIFGIENDDHVQYVETLGQP